MADSDEASTGKPATSLRRLRWIAEIAAVRTVVGSVRLLPPGLRLLVGHGLGRFAWAVDSRHRRVARQNLAAAFPDRPVAWRRQVERDCYRYLGRLLVDVATQCHDVAALAASTEIEGWEHAEAAARLGRGFFLVSGHFGLWERAPLLQAARGLPVLMVARPLDNPYLERWLAGLRRCTGNTLVYKRLAARAMVRGLARGACVGYMVDQNFPLPGAAFPTFFGRPAATIADTRPTRGPVPGAGGAGVRLSASGRVVPHPLFTAHCPARRRGGRGTRDPPAGHQPTRGGDPRGATRLVLGPPPLAHPPAGRKPNRLTGPVYVSAGRPRGHSTTVSAASTSHAGAPSAIALPPNHDDPVVQLINGEDP
jgi:lauroyl/myristoyl acyltransferase